MSSLSWLDFSEHDRRRALDVIELFRERETVDELGVGAIRDAIADLLLPATSVIHTRARYFFFIPWIYQRLEKKKTPSEKVAVEARKAELALVESLLASGETEGVIGRIARSKLRILPSAVYWSALHRLGIRTFPGTRDQYHRSLTRFYARSSSVLRNDDGELTSRVGGWNWNPRLPAPPSDFGRTATLLLRPVEAEFLRERILYNAPQSLYRHLVEDSGFRGEEAFPWEYARLGELSAGLREQIAHARNFSEAIRGAPLLYNLMLAELCDREAAVASYRARIKEWKNEIDARESELAGWNHNRFWQIVAAAGGRVSPATRSFVESWLALLEGQRAANLMKSPAARTLIHERERQLKRGQARLDNQRARELWRGDSGTAQMTYRWEIASRTAVDILDGLAGAPTRA